MGRIFFYLLTLSILGRNHALIEQERIKQAELMFRYFPNKQALYKVLVEIGCEQMIRLFSFLQFGIQCEEGMCYSDIPLERGSNTMIRELDHKEIETRWDEIWELIDACQSGNSFINNEGCCNVGDIFVREKYRGMGVAQDLLKYVAASQHDHHINKLWVEHGTANPNARGFWNKYFHSYSYTMFREI